MEKVWQHPIFPRYIGTRCIVCIGTIQFKTSSDIDIFIGSLIRGAVLAKYSTLYPSDILKGLILLDIVEEAAVQSLNAMPLFIARRPLLFPSLSKSYSVAYEFLLFNEKSARLSVPDLFTDKLTWITDLNATQPYWQTWFSGLSENFLVLKGPNS